ncbi:MAG: dephospho-CoA kinase [Alteraurantiacibacter sp.]
MKRPMVLGLTGLIGMGKSTVAAMFRDLGVPVFDADAAVRAMQGPGGELVAAIEAAFPGTTGPAGVDRKLLKEKVFSDSDALTRLEAIVHPAVAKSRQSFAHAQADVLLVVHDVPLLFEKGLADKVDKVVVVSAPAEVQRARVLAREGMTEAMFAAILAAQMPDAEKRARADYVIDTGTSLAKTRRAVEDLVDKLRGPLRRAPDGSIDN